MLSVALALLAIVVVAALVVAYVAYPHRGRDIPRAGWLSAALHRLVERTGLDPDVEEAATGGSLAEWGEQRRDNRRVHRQARRETEHATR